MPDATRPLVALGVTILAEYGVLLAFVRRSPGRLLLYAALVNALSLPLATYLYWHILGRYWAVEALVALVEAALLAGLLRVGYRRALLLSVSANLVTALLGLALFR